MILQGDCLDVLRTIPDGSIDMILTDPPYGTTACKWDSVIPFEPMWKQLKRVTKPNGAICLFGSEPFSSALRSSNHSEYRYDFYWEKCKPSLYQHAKNRPMKAIELISIFSQNKWGHVSQVKNRMSYYPQGVKQNGVKRVKANYQANHVSNKRPNQIGKEYMSYTGFPSDLLKYPLEKGFHPTQKPVALLEYLIKTYTLPGEKVLDFAMGSGSTGVACTNLKRKFIGIEKDQDYVEIARNRLEYARLEAEGQLSIPRIS